jgi:nucleoside-diphosphate-sugar epimerase
MRILIIGGGGHIGSYLVPRLLRERHDVAVAARNAKPRHALNPEAWNAVTWIQADRGKEEQSGAWEKRMTQLDADVVIDMIAFTPEQNDMLVKAFSGRIRHFLHCGTIWSYGRPRRVPYVESDPRRPIGEYGRKKAQIESDLLDQHARHGFPATIFHPGHICGWGWLPIDPQGTRNGVEVYKRLAAGQSVPLCDHGAPTLNHVHADDIAQLVQLAIENPRASIGEAVSAVAPRALTLEACCEAVAAIFGRKANIEYVTRETFREKLGADAAAATFEHADHSPCCSIEKAQKLLGYAPRYATEQIYDEAIHWMRGTAQI